MHRHLRNAIAAGATFALAATLRADRLPGDVVGVGKQAYESADLRGPWSAVACGGTHTAARGADGRVLAWGSDVFGQCTPPAGLANVVQVAAGSAHTLALRSDGSVAAWGLNDDGQCSVPADVGVAADV